MITKHNYALSHLCILIHKTRQSYYKSIKRYTEECRKASEILSYIREIRSVHPRIGTDKLRHILASEYRCFIGRDKLYTILRVNHLLIARKRKKIYTTNSHHFYRRYKNSYKDITVTAPNQAWVSDITYMRAGDKPIYLSLITDRYSRKILGYNVSTSLGYEGAYMALKQALSSSPSTTNLLHHSDRGIQYCCKEYTSLLQSKSIKISMTEDGNPYDNALAERMNGILKQEYLLDKEFSCFKIASKAVKQAIDAYNNHRPHRSLNMMTPNQTHNHTVPHGVQYG